MYHVIKMSSKATSKRKVSKVYACSDNARRPGPITRKHTILSDFQLISCYELQLSLGRSCPKTELILTKLVTLSVEGVVHVLCNWLHDLVNVAVESCRPTS